MMYCIFVRDRDHKSKIWKQANMYPCFLVDRPPAPSLRGPYISACTDRSLHSACILRGDVLRHDFDFIAAENAQYCICMDRTQGTLDSVARGICK